MLGFGRAAPGINRGISETTIAPSPDSRGPDAAGLGAGMFVIAGILLGAAIGTGIGLLVDRLALGIMVGSTLGLILGFYLLYLRFFKTP